MRCAYLLALEGLSPCKMDRPSMCGNHPEATTLCLTGTKNGVAGWWEFLKQNALHGMVMVEEDAKAMMVALFTADLPPATLLPEGPCISAVFLVLMIYCQSLRFIVHAFDSKNNPTDLVTEQELPSQHAFLRSERERRMETA
eukprot:1136807-Pelagomonas_calceolata.AAC.6